MEKLPEGWKRVRLGEIIMENSKSPFKVEDADNEGKYLFFTSGDNILKHSVYLVDGENLFLSTGGSAYVYYHNGKVAYSADTYSLKSKINAKYLYYYLLRRIDFINFRFFIGSGLEHLQKEDFKNRFTVVFPSYLPEQHKIAEILETVDNAIEKTNKIIEKYKRIKQGLMQDLLTKGVKVNGEGGGEGERWRLRDEKIDKFKDSPLGRIPEEWEVVELKKVSFITMGQSPSSSLINKNGKGLAFLQGNAEFTNKYPNPINWIEKPLKIANKGSILISVRAPIGALNLANTKYCIGRGLASIEANDNFVDNYFLWYSMKFFINKLIKSGQGSTFEAIGSNELKVFSLPLPPLPEQHRIVSILSQIDEAIEKEQKYKEKLERIKQGLMEDLLTGKIRVNHLIDKSMENVSQIG